MRYIACTERQMEFYSGLVMPDGEVSICTAETVEGVKHNNADVAILEGRSCRALKKERNFGHLKEVYLPLEISVLGGALFWGLRYLVRGRMFPSGTVALKNAVGQQRRFLRVKIRPKKKHLSERSYYPADWTPLDLLKWLDEQQANYAVLRWHEAVLKNMPMNDIDILIDDGDVARIRAGLDHFIGTRPVDLHAVSGGETGRIDRMAYFPVRAGKKLLRGRVRMEGGAGWRPCDRDYFESLAYHAVFNKGIGSGLAENKKQRNTAEGKIYKELSRLREKCDVTVELTLEGLFDYLKTSDWMPSADMVAKLAERNKWLKRKTQHLDDGAAALQYDYFMFLFRDIVKQWGNIGVLKNGLTEMGFDIIYEKELAGSEKEYVAEEVRGGNWSAGPYRTDGGKPFYAVLVRDRQPLKMSRKQRKSCPSIKNARILRKREWRDRVNAGLPQSAQANFVHTSDNNAETLEYLKVVAPEALELLL